MPTYEYRCSKGHDFERFQRMSDDPVSTCPECGEPAERLLSGGAGFLFKGSGFYITDYRSDSYRKAEKAEKSDGGGTRKDKAGTSGGDSAAASGGKSGDAAGPASSAAGSSSSSGSKGSSTSSSSAD